MARGWHYTKCLSFLFFCLLFFCSRWRFVDALPIFSCPADRVLPDWQPRIVSLGMVEARSVNAKKTTLEFKDPEEKGNE